MPGRYVVLGLALARSPWFRSVAAWANAASIPVEFLKCMSAIELRAHLASGRPFSALLVDGGLPALDRDLVDEARSAGCAVIVVDDLRVTRDWRSLGASAVINPVFDRKDLIDVLAQCASEIVRADALPGDAAIEVATGWRARVATVCGPGGTGASTAAIALAQGLADDVRYEGMVLLADFARNGEQAMLHDARDVVPGVQELVDAHRTGRPSVDEVRGMTFDIIERRYQLLLGLRRARNWSALRPRAFHAAFENLTRTWKAIVCDTDADLEGEDDGGSMDVEERNLLARASAGRADAVFVVGLPGMKGLHALVRTIGELLDHGVNPERLIPVVNRAPKHAKARSELTASLFELLEPRLASAVMPSPIHLPDRKVDDALRDGLRLHGSLTAPLAGAFRAVVDRAGTVDLTVEAQLIAPGTIGAWAPNHD